MTAPDLDRLNDRLIRARRLALLAERRWQAALAALSQGGQGFEEAVDVAAVVVVDETRPHR